MDAGETLLFVLASSPAVVAGALNMPNPLGGSTVRYDVVVHSHGGNKIQLIKLFREYSGLGLSESKAWTEGKTVSNHSYNYRGCVVASNKTYAEAEAELKKFKAMGDRNGYSVLKLGVIRHNDEFNGAETDGVHCIVHPSDPTPSVPASVPHPMYASDV